MDKIRLEEMVPEELLRVQREKKAVFLPIGSMEWHGPHMGMGMDTMHAERVALRLAEEIGGAVFPPLYIGTETERTEESLKRLGFSGHEKIKGMDFPANAVKSCYWPAKLFYRIVKEQVRMLRGMGFSRIVILNGHASAAQKELLGRICEEEKAEGAMLISITVLFQECGVGLGHAGLAETSIMQAVRPDAVDLEKLPPKPEPLYYKDYGIADSGGSESGFFIRHDPRDASEELGENILDYEVKRCRSILEEWMR